MPSWISKLKEKITGKKEEEETQQTVEEAPAPPSAPVAGQESTAPPAEEVGVQAEPAREEYAEVAPTRPSVMVGPASIEARPSAPGDPVEAFIQRMETILSDPEVAERTKAVKPTCIQMIVGGTPIMLSKEGVKPLTLSRRRGTQADVFIRMSDEAAGKLAATTTLNEFGELYHLMASARGTPYYVNITLQVDLDDLRRRGYFSVGLLRALIDA